jgi:hypothetical protein
LPRDGDAADSGERLTMAKHYRVEAVWDGEAGVYYAKSDIPGLNVEAATMAEFIEVVRDLAADLIAANEPEHAAAHTVRLEADLDLAHA